MCSSDLERALALGCLFSINPDAHSTEEIDNIQWGVLMARKGAVPKERVLNARSLSEFREHLQARKGRLRAAASRTSGKPRCSTDPLDDAVSPPARKHA